MVLTNWFNLTKHWRSVVRRPLHLNHVATRPSPPHCSLVTVVGAGPVGLFLSVLLSRFGLPHLVVERAAAGGDHSNAGPAHPRAHVIHSRTIELLRSVGLADAMLSEVPPLAHWREFRYCSALLGEDLITVDHSQTAAYLSLGASTPSGGIAHLMQPKLEALLAREAHSTAAGPATFLYGHQCVGLEQGPNAVQVKLCPVESPSDPIEVTSQYVVAADGAHSFVRKQCGIEMIGEPCLEDFVSVHFRCPTLGSLLCPDRCGMLYFVFNASQVAVVIAHDLQQGEFVAQVPFFKPLQQAKDFTPDHCRPIIQALIGSPDVPFEIVSTRGWEMHAYAASSLQQGRIFLVGDAAQQVAPAGGFGVNTGLQHAHNLAWKLAAVHHGLAPPALLASYQTERHPVAIANAAKSVLNYRRGIRSLGALGIDRDLARGAVASLAALPGTRVPRLLRDGLQRVGQRPLEWVAPSGGDSFTMHWLYGRDRLHQLRRAILAGEGLPMVFPKTDLGVDYGSTTQQAATLTPQAIWERAMAGSTSGPAEVYHPSFAVGRRLPHLWLQRPGGGPRLSSLDLVPAAGPPRLALLTWGPAAPCWAAAAAALRRAGRATVEVAVVVEPGGPAAADAALPREAAVVVDAAGGWLAVPGCPPTGALLVRPDGHIAWASPPSPGPHVADLLQRAAGTVFKHGLCTAP